MEKVPGWVVSIGVVVVMVVAIFCYTSGYKSGVRDTFDQLRESGITLVKDGQIIPWKN